MIRLQSLIEELFTLSQAEVNKRTLDLQPVDAGAVVRERVAAMAPLAWQPGRVQVTAEIAAGIPKALADRMRLEQSLTNLIYNAVRYTRPGGVVVVAVSAEPEAVRIDVRDFRRRDRAEGPAEHLGPVLPGEKRGEEPRLRAGIDAGQGVRGSDGRIGGGGERIRERLVFYAAAETRFGLIFTADYTDKIGFHGFWIG